ncbi:MAG: ATP-binding protein [Nodosilinea sp.]
MTEDLQASMQVKDEQTMELRIQTSNMISRSLLFSLSRQHLDVPLTNAQFIQPLPPPDKSLIEEPCFLRIEQIGESVNGSFDHALTALQTSLSACHAPDQYTLIFLVTSDGCENHIYLGIRSHNHSLYPSIDFLNNIGHFLQGNWPGTRATVCNDDDPVLEREVLQPLRNDLRNAVALTGIPSLKRSDQISYPQSLDRFLRGFRGLPFIYMVVAEPMATSEVDDIVYRCRDLMSQVHALTKITQTLTTTAGGSQSEGWNINRSEAKSTATTTGETVTKDNRDWLTLLGLGTVGAAGAALGFSPLTFAVALNAVPTAIGQLSPVRQKSKSTAETDTETTTSGVSGNTTLSLSAAEAFGQEYVNAHAQAAEAQLQQFTHRFEQSRSLGCWDVGVYLLTNRPDIAQQGGTQLSALLTGEKTAFEPIRVHDLTRVWTKCAKSALHDFQQPSIGLVQITDKAQKEKFTRADRVEHPLGLSFSGLTTPLNTEELALLVNLPRREVPGVRVMPTADFSLNPPVVQKQDIILGRLLEGGEPIPLNYGLSLKTLAKHTLVTGITGSGKTTTCQTLLTELHRQHIPFLVIEPAKEEYVEWAIQQNKLLPPNSPDRIAVYMPGVQTWRGHKLEDQLTLNPFDIVWLSETTAPQVLSHIDRLKSILTAAFPMQEILPILMEDILFDAYSCSKDWLSDPLPPFNTSRPTLSLLLDRIQPVIQGKGYEERIRANLTAALTTRIQSLRRGWKKQLFDQPKSTPWDAIFDRPAIINLSHLGDDADKAFTMAVLLQFLYEYRLAQHELLAPEESRSICLRHLTVIEEAHRILLRVPAGSMEQANPQAKVAEMFANILSEIRAYGQGLLIADQVPARLVPDAIKNTNLKIVHRLVAADDRDAMSACMALTSEQSAIINRLRPGQAIVCGEQDDMAAWVQISPANSAEV